jgi:hypothetical protein
MISTQLVEIAPNCPVSAALNSALKEFHNGLLKWCAGSFGGFLHSLFSVSDKPT